MKKTNLPKTAAIDANTYVYLLILLLTFINVLKRVKPHTLRVVSKCVREMCSVIDSEEAGEYYRKVAKELERIAESVRLHSDLDCDLSTRLREFANQIRQDSGLCAEPCTVMLN